MRRQKTTSNSGKRKQKKGSAPNGVSQLAAGGELHQIADGEHPALTTNQGVALSYCPSHVVAGIDFSNDPLLQGRLLSYHDRQLLRLGSPNFHQIPINAPKSPFSNHQCDGHMQMAQRGGVLRLSPTP